MDLRKYIVPTKLDNTDENQKSGNKSFQTEDLIYLDSYDEVEDISVGLRITYPTDYAIMNNALMSSSNQGPKGRKSCWTWLRSAFSSNGVYKINTDGDLVNNNVNFTYGGLCPALHLNLSSVISARSASRDFFRISEIKTKGSGKYHTIEFGEYPKTYVGDRKNKELEKLYSSRKLVSTGKTYTGRIDNDGELTSHSEFEYKGQKYVRVLTKKYDGDSEYSDGTMAPEDGTYMWVRVEPIVWKIRNWDELPKEINPTGSGKAKFIDIRTDEAIISGIPFYPDYDDKNCSMWQNSTVRGYLNGINVNNIKTNGNTSFTASKGGNFTGKNNFLNEAFNISISMEKTEEEIEEKTEEEQIKEYNPYGFVYDDLDNDDLLNLYIVSRTPVFLHGPSGVGKSARVKQVDPTATRITLRPQMNPEEIDGTLDRETGKYIPPLWWQELTEKCKAEPNRTHVLFIDELTNVKPTVQSLVYSIVLDRAGKDGLWPLPDNCVVVAAGNEAENNLAAYPLTNALFRRFTHLYYEVDKNKWLDWATGFSKVKKQSFKSGVTKEPRAKIHPAIVAYIMSREEKILNQELDEENPKIVTDPRKWEIASNVLYATKNPYSLKPSIGEDLTTDFANFVSQIHISVEDIVKNTYNKNYVKELNFSEKLSNLVGLCLAEEKDLPQVRKFVLNYFGRELLANYDLLWIRNDPERAMIIDSLPPLENKNADINEEKTQKPASKQEKKITVDEFWNGNNICIHCNEEWKANILLRVFARMGKTWRNGLSYTAVNYWALLGDKICYKNEGTCLSLADCEKTYCGVYEFEEVDLSKYLSRQEVMELETNLRKSKSKEMQNEISL